MQGNKHHIFITTGLMVLISVNISDATINSIASSPEGDELGLAGCPMALALAPVGGL